MRTLGIPIPEGMFADLCCTESEQLGTAEYAPHWAQAAGELFERWSHTDDLTIPVEGVSSVEIHAETLYALIDAAAGGLEEMRSKVRSQWNHEMDRRKERIQGAAEDAKE